MQVDVLAFESKQLKIRQLLVMPPHDCPHISLENIEDNRWILTLTDAICNRIILTTAEPAAGDCYPLGCCDSNSGVADNLGKQGDIAHLRY
jgi:hypothetical protein